ncbi:reticulon domain protein [Diplonema papillatum]|nr:reticulon domain protein [Diplonema papillatum]
MQVVKQIVDDTMKSSSQDLQLWKDPKCSAIIFGLGLLVMYFFSLTNYCIITAILTVFQITLVATFIGGFLGMKVEKKQPSDVEGQLTSYFKSAEDVIVPLVTNFLTSINAVVRWEDYATSGKWLVGSLFVVWLLNQVSIFTLCLTAWLLWWSLPVAYDKNKDKIDPVVNKVRTQFEEKVKTVPKLAELLGYNQKKVE